MCHRSPAGPQAWSDVHLKVLAAGNKCWARRVASMASCGNACSTAPGRAPIAPGFDALIIKMWRGIETSTS
jgi:hypothetical protein